MSIIIFLLILSLLIFVHEMGHFLAAKYFGIRVDEFGLGFPPRAAKLFRWKGTDFTLNWLPFGGFVKIFGENPEVAPSSVDKTDQEHEIPLENSSDVSPGKHGQNFFDESRVPEDAVGESFQNKNRGIQAVVLFAGVFFNFIFAWLLISLGFMSGISAPVGMSLPVEDARTMITTVLPASPAGQAGIKSGDAIVSLSRGGVEAELAPSEAADFISGSLEPVTFVLERGGELREVTVTPEMGIVAERPAIGIAMDLIGTVQLGIFESLWQGMRTSVELTWLTAKALGGFISQALVGRADLSQVTGPVGIVGMVGDVRELGFSFLLTFTALISINLAIINLVPFPALDGGRLVFVGIESITRRPVPAKIFNIVNTVGFALLIFLMLLITFRDVRNIL
jgi:regulator of sigma E protease